MGELLLELLSEEIPARMQRRAIEEFAGLVRDKLAAAEIPAEDLRGYVTPRRLTIIADGIPGQQPHRSEERRGPRVGAPPQAIDGFLRASGLGKIDECEIRDTGRGEFYFAVVERPGRPAAEILPELLRAAIGELPWPKSMRYPASTLRWVRPLVSALCLFDGAVLKLALDQIPVGRTTRGHRFLSEGEIAVENAQDYLGKLEAAHVILDQERRRDLIAADFDRLAAAHGLAVKPDPALLDEVAGLVEFPVVLMGRIDEASMALPAEVLATAMRTHQKYFSCLNPGGTPAPRFLFVANNLTADHGKTIVAGNERVLRARLADARFFWEQDRKVRLEDRVEALRDRVYYDKLGTMYDKTERMELLAIFLATQISSDVTSAQAGVQGNRPGSAPLGSHLRGDIDELAQLAKRAAHLAKADLSTGMVGEFPELQGVMGRYYALHNRADPRIAAAIADHYKPLGPNDACPNAPVSIVVALADKIDSLTAFFWIGERPTGSGDRFALRRAAQGVIRLILDNQLRLPLRGCFSASARILAETANPTDPPADDMKVAEAASELIDFLFDRLRVHARDQGIGHDLIEAARRPGRIEMGPRSRAVLHEDDLTRFIRRVRALQEFLDTEVGANLLVAYRRAANIVAIEEKKGGWSAGEVDPRLLCQFEEKALADGLAEVAGRAGEALAGEDFAEAMAALALLRQPVDEFFDKVTVNADDARLRENRLRLLSRIRAVMNQVADFSQIEG